MFRRKRLILVLLSLSAAVVLSCAGLTAYIFMGPGPHGAAAYPAFRAANATYIPFMPATLTADMSGVRFLTRGFDALGFMAPDGHVELRFILPPAQAAALEAASTAGAVAAKPGELTVEQLGSIIDSLETADDEDRATGLPAGFRSHIVFRAGANVGGVSINATSGEVVYWRVDF